MQQIAQGAEATVSSDGKTVLKHRFSKAYRHPSLDKSLRQFRTRREGKVIAKLNELGIAAPTLMSVDDKEMKITMSHVNGAVLRDVIERDPSNYGLKFGTLVGRIHSAEIVHGDLTTSNVIDVDGNLYLIDFGLSVFATKLEEKSVDLEVLRRALESRHPVVSHEVFEKVIESYLKAYPGGKDVVARLTGTVQKRGRNKRK